MKETGLGVIFVVVVNTQLSILHALRQKMPSDKALNLDITTYSDLEFIII